MSDPQTTNWWRFGASLLGIVYLVGLFGFLPGENPDANLLVRVFWPYVTILELTGAV